MLHCCVSALILILKCCPPKLRIKLCFRKTCDISSRGSALWGTCTSVWGSTKLACNNISCSRYKWLCWWIFNNTERILKAWSVKGKVIKQHHLTGLENERSIHVPRKRRRLMKEVTGGLEMHSAEQTEWLIFRKCLINTVHKKWE